MAHWKRFLALGTAVIGVALVVAPATGALVLLGLKTVAAGLVWRAAWRARTSRPWLLLAFGASSFLVGHVVLAVHDFTGRPVPFPSIADGFYYLGYVGLVLGALALHRHRRPQGAIADLVDSLIVATGVGLAVWSFFMAPYAATAGLPLVPKVVASGYSFFTLALIAVAARIAVGAGTRNGSYYLLTSSFAAILVADVVATMATVKPALAVIAGISSTVCYVVLAASAMHPSMDELTTPAPRQPAVLTRRRLRLLVLALSLGPIVLVAEAVAGRPAHAATVVIGSVSLCSMVLGRMVLMVRANERTAKREHSLRAAGELLVTATTKESMHEGALAAALQLVGGRRSRASLVTTTDNGEFEVVASSGTFSETVVGTPVPTTALGRGTASVAGAAIDGGPEAAVTSTTVALVSQNELRGALVVTTATTPGPDVASSLTDLGATVALALESAAASEHLHRERVERRFRALIENSTDLVAVVERGGRFGYLSAAVERLLGYTPEELTGKEAIDFVHHSDRDTVTAAVRRSGDTSLAMEARLRHANGTWRTLEITCTNLTDDPDVRGLILNGRDVTERKQLEGELRHQALHDSLTGLANRVLFADRVDHALSKRGDREQGVAVLFVDLDDFKTVNDSLGHGAGDQLLVAVADRLRQALRMGDTAARFGGDEFAVLLDDASGPEEVSQVAERLLDTLSAPFSIDGRDVRVGASIGIVFDGDRAASANIMLRNADMAMYLAKERGKARYELFEESMHLVAFQRLELKADLGAAVANGEFTLVYQPIVDLVTGSIESVEALVRWAHPTRGVVGPDRFIPIAEETGLIVPLGRWVLREACAQLARWRDELGAAAPKSISVNVSVRQLERDDLVDHVREALADAGLSPADLTIELTESILMADTELSRQRLATLKQLGVTLAVDDFGSGYSSLGYLQRFPVDVLKVDRSFIEGLTAPGNDGGVMRAIVDLAAVLNLVVVAEGIELVDQYERVRSLGCGRGQGYLISRPQDADALTDFIAEAAMSGVAVVS